MNLFTLAPVRQPPLPPWPRDGAASIYAPGATLPSPSISHLPSPISSRSPSTSFIHLPKSKPKSKFKSKSKSKSKSNPYNCCSSDCRSNGSPTPISNFHPLKSNPKPSLTSFLSKTLIVCSPIGLLLFSIPGNGGGGGFSVGSGGGGGGGDSWWSYFFSPSAFARDDNSDESWDSHGLPANIIVQLNKLSDFKKYKVAKILFVDLRRCKAFESTEDSLFQGVSLRANGVYTKAQLQKELETLATSGLFKKLDLEGKTNLDGSLELTISFRENTWLSPDEFRCINVGLMPQIEQLKMGFNLTDKELMEFLMSHGKDYRRRIARSRPCLFSGPTYQVVLDMLRGQEKVTASLLKKIGDIIRKWYYDEGYVYAQVVRFGNLSTNEFVCEVKEGDVTQLVMQFYDKRGNVVEGNTQFPVVWRQLPEQLRVGHVFNVEAPKQALVNINSLGLFSNVEITSIPDEKNEGGVIVEIKLKEFEESAKGSTEWSIVPEQQGHPTLSSIQPGGTVSIEQGNIKDSVRSFLGSVSTSGFLKLQDDLASKFKYVHPYISGVYSNIRTFQASCFNSKKLNSFFTVGPGLGEVSPIWVDRDVFQVPVRNTNVDASVEHGSDLGSSIDVKGNPTEAGEWVRAHLMELEPS